MSLVMRLRLLTSRTLLLLLAPLLAVAAVACGDDDDGDEIDATGGGDTTEAETTTTSAPDSGPADVAVASTSLGDVLVDAEGFTLYAFLPDTDGTPTCTEGCAQAWPPATVDGEPTVGEGIDDGVITTVDGADGGTQLVAGDQPLYRFSGDEAAGDVNGQAVAGNWFAVAPDGSLVGQDTSTSGSTDDTTDDTTEDSDSTPTSY
jgi:predicted lipoprotein with Yx(FWY)xxD motif